MLNKNRYFDIIREDVFTDDGSLVLNNYVEEFNPYAVPKQKKAYANFGEIKLLDFTMKMNHSAKKDRIFHIKYLQAQEAISLKVLGTVPILQTEVSDTLGGYETLSPLLKNLTYGDTELAVWLVDGSTYVLVNAGQGDSSCNLLFFCRIEEPRV
ncbi:MAG: Unknown protein [uncultured Sulfurovum sp.]|uniref:Uncharacterized protein n=1 Tax=uncultured Sulfurovum sp. TaxID=269237 RepID=A0A6S6SD38_9BACT|nr:MAG: Unknown protein [uncultured Sulfurovum sp.]